MAGIYGDQHLELSELLNRASNDHGATLLIPDLQRPYVWSPRQVIWLVDSLIRGWPFGTFLTWKVKKDDPVRELARPFWKVVDRTDGDGAGQVTKKDPPGSFQMVLDGQQRIQSLLLAVCGSSWGFRLYDRDWNVALTDEKPRGRQGVKHWSMGTLCVDLNALEVGYAKTKRVLTLDFTNILNWVVTGGKQAQSEFEKKKNYQEPLPRTHEATSKGRYVRLSLLWEAAPAVEGIEQEQAEGIAEALLKDHDVPADKISAVVRPVGSLLLTLSRVKKTRVTYLELAEFDEKIFGREAYNDAVVNIFTRLNTAGRTLTREDITFAWLKVGWVSAKTGNRSAAECFDGLATALARQKLELPTEDLVAGISVLWATFHGEGRLLNNNDLLKGDAIRPMAADLSNNWARVARAVEAVSAGIADRGYRYHQHYESLNSIFLLWAWQYIADQWKAEHPLRELERDGFEKKVVAALGLYGDRWLLCSQWAKRWASGSAEILAGYAKRLSECAAKVKGLTDCEAVVKELQDFLEREVRALESDAVAGVQGIQVRRRELVSGYFAPLWIWHRLDAERWKHSRIQLREGKRKTLDFDVDHSVAHALWEKKVKDGLPAGATDAEEAIAIVNRLGNCSLLEKNFNISKSDRTLKSFLEGVLEFKEKKVQIADWSKALAIGDSILNPDGGDATTVAKAIEERDALIRKELVEFVKGERKRVDMEE